MDDLLWCFFFGFSFFFDFLFAVPVEQKSTYPVWLHEDNTNDT